MVDVADRVELGATNGGESLDDRGRGGGGPLSTALLLVIEVAGRVVKMNGKNGKGWKLTTLPV